MGKLTQEEYNALHYLMMSSILGLLSESDYDVYNKDIKDLISAIFGAGAVIGLSTDELQKISDELCALLKSKGYPAINFQIQENHTL